MKMAMDQRPNGSKGQRTKEFKPRRPVEPAAAEAEGRVVVKARVPASLAKDLQLYALQRGCSVTDLIATIMRRAIPRLEVVTVPDKLTDDLNGRGVAQSEEPAGRHGDDAGSSPAPATKPTSRDFTDPLASPREDR